MGFRKIDEIPFLNIPDAMIIKTKECTSSILLSNKGLSITKTQKEKKYEVPIWEKSTLSLEEAVAYSGIGIHKLRQLTDAKNCSFVLWNGNKRLIKRKKFDEYIDESYSI